MKGAGHGKSKTDRQCPRVLFLDHTAELGGAELCLLDFLGSPPGRKLAGSRVVLFADGPLASKLEAAGATVVIEPVGPAVLSVKRDSAVANLGGVLSGLVRHALRLARQARSFDLVYANSQKAFVIGSLAAWLARKPLVWHLHDILTAQHFGARQRALVVWLANRLATAVIVNSAATADAFVEAGGDRGKVCVVYNGIELSSFEERDPDRCRRQLRDRLGLAPDAFLAGCFSRLAFWKGQHVLLQAVSALTSVHVVLVGGALFGEESYADELRKDAAALRMEERVHFLGFQADVADLLLGIDVAVHCSISPEPFGRVIIEAMAARRPVIASASGAATEIARDGVTALLVSPGDPAALSSALVKLRDFSEEQGSTLTRTAYEDVRARFSLEAYADGIDSVIRRAVWSRR